jgi:membrane protein implicated in regulation of membrane protease activity
LFSGFSIVALLAFRRPLARYVRRSDPSLTIDSLVGQRAVALEDIAVDLTFRTPTVKGNRMFSDGLFA